MHVPHEFKLAIWGHERDCAIDVKATQLDALVELAVIELDGVGPVFIY